MRIAARLVAALAAAVIMAWGLSLLAGTGNTPDRPVFQPDKSGRLTEANLVDALVSLPLELKIAKADFRQSVMSVDLFLPAGVSGERFVYHDLYELSHFAWSGTANVNRLQVRIMAVDGLERQPRELLLAMEAKRQQERTENQPATLEELKAYLERYYQFSYTSKWLERL